MEQKIQGYLHPNIQKPSDEQYFKYKQLVENELGLDSVSYTHLTLPTILLV